MDSLVSEARTPSILSWLHTCRRHLHQHPELSFEEVGTSLYIRQQLDEMGVSYKYPVAKTGIVASLGADVWEGEGKVIRDKWGKYIPTVDLNSSCPPPNFFLL